MTRDELIDALLGEGWQPHPYLHREPDRAIVTRVGGIGIGFFCRKHEDGLVSVVACYCPTEEACVNWRWTGSPADVRRAVRHGELVIRKRLARWFGDDQGGRR